TFAGRFGGAIARATMLVLAATVGMKAALIVAGLIGFVVAVPLLLAPGVEGEAGPSQPVARARPQAQQNGRVFSPAILGLTVFFILLSLSTSGISNFSVVALMGAFALPFATANLALTAFLTASAFGVLGGGFVADLTRRHGDVAAAGFAANAVIMLLIAAIGFAPPVLIAAMGLAGFLSGMIMPSRDMLVRAAAPPGAVGRAFGIVTTGFGLGGMVGPLMFGFAMDRGAPQWVFGISVVLMIAVAIVALVGDRRAAKHRRQRGAAIASAEAAE